MNMIKFIKQNLKDRELQDLDLEGFKFPNEFSIENLKKLILGGKMPSEDDLNEFCFAIYETPIVQIEKLNLWIKLYVYMIFLYSYFKKGGCIDSFDEIYLYLFTKNIVENNLENKPFIEFLKYLKDINSAEQVFFIDLALAMLCQEKNKFLKDYEDNTEALQEVSTVYDDFYNRWRQLIHEENGEDAKYFLKILDIANQYYKENTKNKIYFLSLEL